MGEERTKVEHVVGRLFWKSSSFYRVFKSSRDVMYQGYNKTKLFLSYNSLKSVGSHPGVCTCQGNKEAMRNSSKGQHPSSYSSNQPIW